MAHQSRSGALLATLLLCVGCMAESEEEANFGAEEMKAAVVGDWSGTLQWKDAKSTSLLLHVEYAAPGSSPACSNRTVGMNPMCIDMTTMGVKGTLTTGDGQFDKAAWTGRFEVMGLELRGGYLDLNLAGGVSLSARQGSSGFEDCTVRDASGELGICTLAR